MKTGSLFTGYGGLDMGVGEIFDAQQVWHSEIEPAAVRLLQHHWPHTPNLGDITTIDWATVEPIDMLTAGWPCQDISNAGKRAGIEGERSGLWKNVADAVRVLRPGLVVLENVSAVIVRGLDTVASDLATLGYDMRWTCFRASDIGAPHRRERFFAVAYPGRLPGEPGRIAAPGQTQRGRTFDFAAGCRRTHAATHPESVGQQAGRIPIGAATPRAVAHGDQRATADTESDGRHQRWAEPAGLGGGPDVAVGGDATAWGQYEHAIRGWEHALGRRAPAPTQLGQRGRPQLAPPFVEWLMGLPPGHVCKVPGLTRNQQLKLLGNGVVPQQAAAAVTWLLQQEEVTDA